MTDAAPSPLPPDPPRVPCAVCGRNDAAPGDWYCRCWDCQDWVRTDSVAGGMRRGSTMGNQKRTIRMTKRVDEMSEHRANSRRIVATVNATAGIPTAALEAGVVAEMAKQFEFAVRLLSSVAMFGDTHQVDTMRAVLAKLKGE